VSKVDEGQVYDVYITSMLCAMRYSTPTLYQLLLCTDHPLCVLTSLNLDIISNTSIQTLLYIDERLVPTAHSFSISCTVVDFTESVPSPSCQTR
jgi:hypothetical protein